MAQEGSEKGGGEVRRLLLIGEHDKGLGMPFHPSTVSGRRLREMVAALPVEATIENMMAPGGGGLDEQAVHVERLLDLARGADAVVLLGARVQHGLAPVFPEAVPLPHPGARRPSDLQKLLDGLRMLAMVNL